MKYYIGIDPSLTGSAVAVIDEAGKLLNSQRFANNLKGMERLIFIRNKVMDLLNDYGWRREIKAVGIEGYARGAMNRREESGELGGTLRILLFENRIQYIDIAPSQIKKFATGKGNAQKDHILLAVYKKWSVEFKTNDEADAFVAAQIARAMFEESGDVLTYEKEVLKKLKTGA